MIKITIVGGRNEVERVREVLKKQYGKMYSCRVTEMIPEAVQEGAKYCTASFVLEDKYFDLNSMQKFRFQFEINFNDKKSYRKGKGCNTGKWLTIQR